MRIKTTRASYGDFGHLARNHILDDVPSERARDLIEHGRFTAVQGSTVEPVTTDPKPSRPRRAKKPD